MSCGETEAKNKVERRHGIIKSKEMFVQVVVKDANFHV